MPRWGQRGRVLLCPLMRLQFYPEMPGVQMAVDELHGLLGAPRSWGILVKLNHPGSGYLYPVWLSVPVQGPSMLELHNAGGLSQAEEQLEPRAFTAKVLASLLVSAEDEKVRGGCGRDGRGAEEGLGRRTTCWYKTTGWCASTATMRGRMH